MTLMTLITKCLAIVAQVTNSHPQLLQSTTLEVETLESRYLLSGNSPIAVNDAPIVASDRLAIVDVLANDIPGDRVTLETVFEGDHGEASILENGKISYLADEGFLGTDSFDYEIGLLPLQLQSADTVNRDQFASAVDIDDDHAIVGARLAEGEGQPTNSGLAYIYRRLNGDWIQVATLQAPDAEAADYFGWSVEIDGGLAVVGARRSDNGSVADAGAAYVFSRNEGGANNWGLVTKLENPNPESNDQFGSSVAIDGNTIAVGAWLDDDPSRSGTNQGSVSLFERNLGGRNNWGYQTTVFDSTPVGSRNRFGSSLAIEGDVLVVGANRNGGANTGSVFVYERNRFGSGQWGEAFRIDNPEPQTGDNFGQSLSFSDGTIAIGSPLDDVDGSVNAGSVFLFDQISNSNEWIQVAKLTADPTSDSRNGTSGDLFGDDVSISGDRLVIGASGTSRSFGATGLVYSYQRDNTGQWQFVELIETDDQRPGDRLGSVIALSGEEMILGVPLDDIRGTEDGSALFVSYATDTGTVNLTVVESIPGNITVSGDATPLFSLTDSIPNDSLPGNRQFFSNLLGVGTSVAIFDESFNRFAPVEVDEFFSSLPGVRSKTFSDITDQELAGVDLVVLPYTRPISNSEKSVLRSHVLEGTNIFLTAESSGIASVESKISVAAVNDILEFFQTDLRVVDAVLDRGPQLVSGSRIIDHPLTEGVTSFAYGSTSIIENGDALFRTTSGDAFISTTRAPNNED